ncbi:IS4 family transposase [Melittangium boletus]|uniref:IS4 family transposase n=1 Tax=Melittangium boletus TaxID=83453 RepID=UPI003DA257A8
MRKPRLDDQQVHAFLESLFEEDLHARRVLSLAYAVLGVIHAASLGVHLIGKALAWARGTKSKHGVKQVDRLLSNQGIDVWELFAHWVPYALGQRSEAVVALDWTDFDADGQTTLVASLVASHGRTTPLVWHTVEKSALEGMRNETEDFVLQRLRQVVPEAVRLTVLADRGVGDQKFYALLEHLKFEYVVRFRQCIQVKAEAGEKKSASEWVPASGRAAMLTGARVTQDEAPVGAVVCVKKKGMKEAWCLATSLKEATAAFVVELYAQRFGRKTVKIQLSDLRRSTNALFDHLERTGRTEIEITEDFYWNIPEKHLYSVYTPPTESELTMGQLSDDWNEVEQIASGQRPPTAYALVWLSSIMRIIGSKLIS